MRRQTTPREPILVPAPIMAEALGVGARRIQQLAAAGIVVRVGHGGYDLLASLRNARDLEDERGDKGNGTLAAARLRYWSARGEREELEVSERRHELVPRGQVTKALEYFVTVFRSRLVALPRKLALQLSPENPRAVEAAIERETTSILEDLSTDETLPEWAKE